ncbi:MAG: AAA family ATPase [Thalassovita sp.]
MNERRALDLASQQRNLGPVFAQAKDPRQKLDNQRDDLPFTKTQLQQNPASVLDHISQTKASFNRVDMLRALAKRIDKPAELQDAAARALKSPELMRLDAETMPRFTTRDYRDAEESLFQSTDGLAIKTGFSVDQRHVGHAISDQDRLMKRAFGGQLSTEQRDGLAHILGANRLSCVVGLAGAGKSTLLDTARDAWRRQGFVVHGAALAGKAADGLQEASGIPSRTLASLEMSWQNGHEPIKSGEVLVVDEAGMIGPRQMARVAAKMEKIGAKLVLVGDPDQLQPIEAGKPSKNMIDQHGATQLTEIHRQREDWKKQASKALAQGDCGKALRHYADHNAVSESTNRDDNIERPVQAYRMNVAVNGDDTSRLAFAHKRKDVFALNQAIRTALREDDDAPALEQLYKTDTGPRAFAAGDRFVFGKNDKDLGVKNGMLGTVEQAAPDELCIRLDGDQPRKVRFNPLSYQSFDHSYAVTVHKSQGATVDHAYVLASRSMDQHLAYVAMTRHRDQLQVFVDRSDKPTWARSEPEHPRHRTREGPGLA